MSLKHFHIFFIALSIGLMVFVLSFCRSQGDFIGLARTAWAMLGLSFVYLGWFLRKYKVLA